MNSKLDEVVEPRGYFTEIMFATAFVIAVVLFTFFAMYKGWV